ncbi:MAG TPA: hypothetical protein VFV46_05340 [Lacibacter sp.]|nr:hypothetical protein [Lacibacter sp.]
MKKWTVILVVVLLSLTGILYVGISSQQSFSKSIVVGCTNEGALRMLTNEAGNKKGWPGTKLNDSTYQFEELTYTVGTSLLNIIALRFEGHARGELIIEETMPDSSRFTVAYSEILPLQPLKRIISYNTIQKTKTRIENLLTALKKNFDGEELVYGITIQKTRVTDSVMISTRKILDHYPSVEEVYQMIDAIRFYIMDTGGEETSNPMLNVFNEDKNQYLVMVAVPTKTAVNGNNRFLQKRMLANGFILVSEVQGGNAAIQSAEAAMKQYVADHQKSSPAIPFQMLLTDRRAEPDTAKWKTRLYYPVMY